MPEAGQEIEGFGGMSLLLVHTGRAGRELLEMEASYTGEAGMPPQHLHPKQAERFEVLEGTMRAIVDGEERVYDVGESFEVPVGTPHQMAAEGPTRMRWEVKPALRTAEFFERLNGEGPAALGRWARPSSPSSKTSSAWPRRPHELLGDSQRPLHRRPLKEPGRSQAMWWQAKSPLQTSSTVPGRPATAQLVPAGRGTGADLPGEAQAAWYGLGASEVREAVRSAVTASAAIQVASTRDV